MIIQSLADNNKRKNKPSGYWTNETVENVVREMVEDLGRFPTSNEIEKKYGSHCDRCIVRKYPGGRKGLAEKLGFDPMLLKYMKFESKGKIIDPNRCEIKYKRRRAVLAKGFPDLSAEHNKLLRDYISDKELGLNSKRRKVSFGRLYVILNNTKRIFLLIQKEFNKSAIKLTRREIHDFFDSIKEETAKSEMFKRELTAFWNWFKIKQSKENVVVENLMENIYLEKAENSFVYFTFDELKKVLPKFTKIEQTILKFCFDSIIRTPKELANLKVKDIKISDNEVWVNIRDETSKTYGRRFNLLISDKEIQDYLHENNLDQEEFLFPDYSKSSEFREALSKKLKKVFVDAFGKDETPGGKSFDKITLYSFRHSGACWMRAKDISINKLLYRGGWKTLERLNYYTKVLGLDGFVDKRHVEK